LPTASLYPSNTLTIEFLFERGQSALASTSSNKPPSELFFAEPASDGSGYPEAAVLRTSEINLHGIPRLVALPRLDLLANAGFPFTRMADLSDTAVVLPADATLEQIGLYLDLLGSFGAQTGYPALGVTALEPAAGAAARGKDLLVIGTPEDQPLFGRWSGMMPVRYDGARMQLAGLGGLFERFENASWTYTGKSRRALEEMLSANAHPDAVVEAFGSPVESGRSVVAFITSRPRDLEPLVTILAGSVNTADAYGTVSVLEGGRFHSFHLTSGAYHSIDPSWREEIHYWILRYFWLLPVLIVLSAIPLAAQLRSWVENRAGIRLRAQV
jgi:cellulose synthase (UDP-forming)